MTRAKPKVIHVVVTPEMHKRITEAGTLAEKTVQLEMSMSDVVRWLLTKGLDAFDSSRAK